MLGLISQRPSELSTTALSQCSNFLIFKMLHPTDVEYIRPLFALLTVLSSVFNCFRIPYRVIVINVGHYKQTKNGAIMEAVLHIVISVLGVIKFGLIGVAFGALVAMVFRSCQYAIYLSNNIMHRDIKYFVIHVLFTFGKYYSRSWCVLL